MKIIHHELYDEIVADEGKVFVKKSTGERMGTSIALGCTKWLNGKALAEPHWEKPEDYEEVPMTESEMHFYLPPSKS